MACFGAQPEGTGGGCAQCGVTLRSAFLALHTLYMKGGLRRRDDLFTDRLSFMIAKDISAIPYHLIAWAGGVSRIAQINCFCLQVVFFRSV